MVEHSRKDDKEIMELKELLREHIQGEEKTVHEILNELKEMREQLTPLVELWESSNGFYKTFMWGVKTITIIAAGAGALLFIKKL